MTADFDRRDLIVSRRVDEYDGTTAVTRSDGLEPEEIEFMRWQAERWMKVRHLPTVVRHDPGFVLRNGVGMLRHTFRGSTWRSMLGFESPRAAFKRYRAMRTREREYLDWPDPFVEASTLRIADTDQSQQREASVRQSSEMYR